MKRLKILALIALVFSLGTVNAKAMGEREVGALIGLAAGAIIYNIIDNSSHARTYTYEQPQHVRTYSYERPRVVYEPRYEPYYTHYRNNHQVQKIIIIDKRYDRRDRRHDGRRNEHRR
jgi:hypothetical protein